jgi:serine/threonine protein phosphatase PrpC
MTTEMKFGAQSDTGCVRENNEDSFRVAPEMNLFVLSDGMGGLEAGEVASRMAVDAVLDHCRQAEANPEMPLIGERIESVSAISNRLASAIRVANESVYRAAQQGAGLRGMGATIVAVKCTDHRMSVAHVGDSRIYRLRGGRFEQLTTDHSFVAEQVRNGKMTQQEADSSTMQNVLVRALGIDPTVEVDLSEVPLLEGDTVLLCSDGLTRELSDSQIAAVLAERRSAESAAGELVELAKQAGGGDNVTVIVLRYAAKSTGALARIGKWFKKSA